jgi:hypothetical protein
VKLDTFPVLRSADGTYREFLASASNRVKPMWIDKLFAAELKQQKRVEKEHAKRRAMAALQAH